MDARFESCSRAVTRAEQVDGRVERAVDEANCDGLERMGVELSDEHWGRLPQLIKLRLGVGGKRCKDVPVPVRW